MIDIAPLFGVNVWARCGAQSLPYQSRRRRPAEMSYFAEGLGMTSCHPVRDRPSPFSQQHPQVVQCGVGARDVGGHDE